MRSADQVRCGQICFQQAVFLFIEFTVTCFWCKCAICLLSRRKRTASWRWTEMLLTTVIWCEVDEHHAYVPLELITGARVTWCPLRPLYAQCVLEEVCADVRLVRVHCSGQPARRHLLTVSDADTVLVVRFCVLELSLKL